MLRAIFIEELRFEANAGVYTSLVRQSTPISHQLLLHLSWTGVTTLMNDELEGRIKPRGV